MTVAADLSLVATCALGLEELLEEELRDLGVSEPSRERGAVAFRGSWSHVWRANLWLRTANRVLVEVARWQVADDEDLTRGAGELLSPGAPLEKWLTPDRTFSIRAASRHPTIRDIRWISVKVKDGLVDRQREIHGGQRSSIDRELPDLPFRVLLDEREVTLLLDSSRESLDRRGYRLQRTDAPVREQIAAACILASGWNREGPVVDPMCGSGTLLAEAGWIAQGRAPGLLRETWAFESWPSFERADFESLKKAAHGAVRAEEVELYGSDLSEQAIRAARRNLEAAGLAKVTRLKQGDAFDLDPPKPPGLVVMNPPYGQRAAATPDQWRHIGDLLKKRYPGYTAVVLAGDESRGKYIGLRPRRKIPVRNGPIDARILVFDLY